MKRIKKLASLLLAMVMVLAMSTTAFAAEPGKVPTEKGTGNFKITLNNDQSGHTYSAYQVFKGDLLEDKDENGDVTKKVLSNIEWGTGVNEDGLIAAIKGITVVGEDGKDATPFSSLADDATAADVAELLEGKGDNSAITRAFADVIGAHLGSAFSGSKCEEIKAGDATVGYEITGLNAGYYLVQDTGSVGEADAYTRYIMQVVSDVTTNVKTEIPTIEKKIVEGDNLVDANQSGIGQIVSYQIKGNVPNHLDYEKYFYVISDTLSPGLTFNDDIVVTIGGASATLGTDYYVYTGDAAEGKTFQVAFDETRMTQLTVGAEIIVSYSATVNGSAVIGEVGNPNKVTLEYSNNPNNTGNGKPGEPGKPDDNTPTGETPEDITVTYVAKIDILKTKEDGTILAGAEFTLTGTSTQTILATNTYYEPYEDGDTLEPDNTWYLLKTGVYTKDAPTPEERNTEGVLTKYSNEDAYVSNMAYKKVTVTEKTTKDIPVKMIGISDENGKLSFGSLGAGTYIIEETVVPAGYNKAENMTVVIECALPKNDDGEIEIVHGNEKAEWSVGADTTKLKDDTGKEVFVAKIDVATSGSYDMTIKNQSGSVLPSTGGIGTTIFYVVGGILVVVAGILLVTKKRMSAR